MLLPVLFLTALGLFLVRERRAYHREVVAAVLAQNEPTTPPPDPSIEPAYQFPGIPADWSLDRYAKDGLQQIQIMLTQAARRPDATS